MSNLYIHSAWVLEVSTKLYTHPIHNTLATLRVPNHHQPLNESSAGLTSFFVRWMNHKGSFPKGMAHPTHGIQPPFTGGRRVLRVELLLTSHNKVASNARPPITTAAATGPVNSILHCEVNHALVLDCHAPAWLHLEASFPGCKLRPGNEANTGSSFALIKLHTRVITDPSPQINTTLYHVCSLLALFPGSRPAAHRLQYRNADCKRQKAGRGLGTRLHIVRS